MFRHMLASLSNIYKLSRIPTNPIFQPILKSTNSVKPSGQIFVANMSNAVVKYNDVLNATCNEFIYIIDVREPSELQKTGIIPNSVNIPLAQVEDVFKNMSADEFLRIYGRPKPAVNSQIIFSCQAGRRAATASDTAIKLGFSNTHVYKGSWGDWEQQIKQNK